MQSITQFLPAIAPYALISVLIVTFIAGFARGFTGFGSGLIVMPVASAFLGPAVAVAVYAIADIILTLPLMPRAFALWRWKTVLPAAVAAVLTVPLGAILLANSDPLLVRWGLSFAILAMLALLVSGWHYHGEPTIGPSALVGAGAGFLGGVGGIPGPPIVAFWMAGPLDKRVIRANLIAFFLFTGTTSLLAYAANGLLTTHALGLAIIVGPVYGLAVFTGARLHHKASDRQFRFVVYTLIVISAVTSLPILDGLLRPSG